MKNQPTGAKSHPLPSGWLSRILIAAIVGILFLTLFPFRFAFHTKLAGGASPFLLGRGGKPGGSLGFFLNVLLFVPFGFGVSGRFREWGKSRAVALFLTLLVSALFSYSIEFVQIYIPVRDSGWDDIVSNSMGALVGALFFDRCGETLIRILSRWERKAEGWLSIGRIALILLLYFGAWFAISIQLQKDTRLSNWLSDCRLLVGNDGKGQHPWEGKIFRLQVWDGALRNKFAQNFTSGDPMEESQPGLLASYDFSDLPPFRDQKEFLPALSWTPDAPAVSDAKALVLDGHSWLTSKIPVVDLSRDLQRTNQFTIRVICAPDEVSGVDGRVVSISDSSGRANLYLGQVGANLVFWFRNPLSTTQERLAWSVPAIFVVKQVRDILFSYDGSALSLYIDGKREPRTYRLGPGASLVHRLVRIKTAELDIYVDLYYSAIFLPAGFLLGMSVQKMAARKASSYVLFAFGSVLPAFLLEFILVHASGREASVANVILPIFLSFAGLLWANSERRADI